MRQRAVTSLSRVGSDGRERPKAKLSGTFEHDLRGGAYPWASRATHGKACPFRSLAFGADFPRLPESRRRSATTTFNSSR